MKAVRKFFGVIFAILLSLVLILVCVFLFWLGPTVKLVAEKVGTKVLGVPLTVEKLYINPRHGTVHMTGFSIANPEQFNSTNAVSLDSLDIAIDVSSIFASTVIVQRVQLDSPYFTYEQSTATDNISEFITRIQSLSSEDDEPPKDEKTDAPDTDKTPKVVIVQSLEINDVLFRLLNTDTPQLDIDAGFEQLAVSMTNGMVRLKNLHVSNPRELENPNLFTLDEVTIELDSPSIYSAPLSIRDVQVVRPYAYVEINKETDTVAEFMKIANRLASRFANLPSGDTTAPMETAPDPEPETAAVSTNAPIELHNLLVDDIQIRLRDTKETGSPAEPRLFAGIGSISVKLVEGRIEVKGITVPNPEGFTTTNLFHLANIDISIDPATIFTGPPVINEVFVNSPEINLEQTATGANIADLQDLITALTPPPRHTTETPAPVQVVDSEEQQPPTNAEEPAAAGQPVLLHSLVVTNMAVKLTTIPSTNTPAMLSKGMKQLNKLNPLDKVSLNKLNPLEYIGGDGAKDQEMAETGPLMLLNFGRLSVRPLEGHIVIDGLSVANPHGFANRNLAQVKQLKVDFDPATLESDTLLVKEVLIDQPRVVYEQQIDSDNIEVLQSEINKVVASHKASESEVHVQNQTGPQAQEPSQKVIIEHVQLKDGVVRAKLSALPTLPIIPLELELRDLGKKEGGIGIGKAFSTIGKTIYETILGAVANTAGFAGDALKGAGSMTFGTLGSVAGGLTEGVGSLVGMEKKTEEAKPSESKSDGDLKPAKRRSRTVRRLPGRAF